MGTTPSTVSVVMAMHAYNQRADQDTVKWLRARQHLPSGGFLAHPQAPIPDLLSTATALHALACVENVLEPVQVEAALDFVDSLWTNQGAFHGHWAEEVLDVEYTYYGLLALGHLSL
jgi:prenyltransferase beta subunit